MSNVISISEWKAKHPLKLKVNTGPIQIKPKSSLLGLSIKDKSLTIYEKIENSIKQELKDVSREIHYLNIQMDEIALDLEDLNNNLFVLEKAAKCQHEWKDISKPLVNMVECPKCEWVEVINPVV